MTHVYKVLFACVKCFQCRVCNTHARAAQLRCRRVSQE